MWMQAESCDQPRGIDMYCTTQGCNVPLIAMVEKDRGVCLMCDPTFDSGVRTANASKPLTDKDLEHSDDALNEPTQLGRIEESIQPFAQAFVNLSNKLDRIEQQLTRHIFDCTSAYMRIETKLDLLLEQYGFEVKP